MTAIDAIMRIGMIFLVSVPAFIWLIFTDVEQEVKQKKQNCIERLKSYLFEEKK
jgi:hypothetical protein